MSGRPTTLAGIVFLVSLFFSFVPSASAANWTVRAQPARLVNGGPVLFQAKPPARLESLHGNWLGHDIPFSFDAKSKTWYALAGVSLETAPGTYALGLTGATIASKIPSKKITFSRKFA